MPESYFKNFNTIQYGNSTSNSTVVDITERVVVLNNVQKNLNGYYPMDITDGKRADLVSYNMYKDPYASWTLYLANDIVDPYYEWYMTDQQFNDYIVSKYGSIAIASQKVAFWRNDWVDKPTLSPDAYQAEILGNPERIKYWQANYNYSGTPIDYYRVKEDWKVNTNKIVKLNVAVGSNTSFITNEVLTIDCTALSYGSGKAQVISANSTNIIINNPVGDFITNFSADPVFNIGTITGQESGVTCNMTGASEIYKNLADNVVAYWSPVYYYDYEREKNEGNKTIKTIKPAYVPTFINNVKSLLGQ
jgi:hypothetical protein